MHVSEEEDGCGAEECVYKAVPWVRRGHAHGRGPQLIFSLVSALWKQSPCTEKTMQAKPRHALSSVSSKFWVLSSSVVVQIPNG